MIGWLGLFFFGSTGIDSASNKLRDLWTSEPRVLRTVHSEKQTGGDILKKDNPRTNQNHKNNENKSNCKTCTV